MKSYELIFWEPLVSPHKAGLMEALAALPQVSKVSQIAQAPLSRDRKELGWELHDSSRVSTIVEPSEADVRTAILNSSPAAIHLFSGIHWVPAIVQGIALAIQHKRHFGIQSEPRTFEGVKGLARLAHSWATEGPVRRHVDFVLAIGRYGPPWFRMAGYARNTIFPFAYFVGGGGTGLRRESSGKIRIGFLGRLMEAKGFPLAVDAFRALRSPVEFDIAGSGELEQLALSLANEFPDRVSFCGALPMGAIPEFLAGIDILLVPSLTRNDGWGVVTTEALEAGVAVVTAKYPGASALIIDERFGCCVEEASAAGIANAVEELIANGTLNEEGRKFRAEWAAAHLTADAGARYLLDILGHLYEGKDAPQPLF